MGDCRLPRGHVRRHGIYVQSSVEKELVELPMMNAIYSRYLWYLGLLMHLFLFGIVLFAKSATQAGVVAFFGYAVLAGRAYLFLAGTIFKSLRSDRMLLYGMEFAGAGALAAANGSRIS